MNVTKVSIILVAVLRVGIALLGAMFAGFGVQETARRFLPDFWGEWHALIFAGAFIGFALWWVPGYWLPRLIHKWEQTSKPPQPPRERDDSSITQD